MPTECEKQNRASARHAESIDGNEHATTMTVAPSVSSEKKKKMEDSEAGVVAESETPAAEEPPPSMPAPPNGGLAAWLQVSGAFWIYFNTWCIVFISLSLSLNVENPLTRTRNKMLTPRGTNPPKNQKKGA